MPAPLSGTVLRITPQASCVVSDLVFAAKPQEPQDDTKRLLFIITITLAIDVLVHGVIEWASKERMSLAAVHPTLVISERTARTHVSNILSKLHRAIRTQAVLYALRER